MSVTSRCGVRRAVIVAAVVFVSLRAFGYEWRVPDARTQGIGGAGTALGQDSSTNYWNAGALGMMGEQPWDFTFDFQFGMGIVGPLFDNLEQIDDTITRIGSMQELQDRLNNPLGRTQAEIEQDIQDYLHIILVDFVDLSSDTMGVLGDTDLAIGTRYGQFGVRVSGYGNVEVDAAVDLLALALTQIGVADDNWQTLFDYGEGDRYVEGSTEDGVAEWLEAMMPGVTNAEEVAEEFVYQCAAGGANILDSDVQEAMELIVRAMMNNEPGLVDNKTGVRLKGIAVADVGISYGYPVCKDKVAIGGTIRYLEGTTYASHIYYEDIEDVEGAEDAVQELLSESNLRTSSNVGVDLGIYCLPIPDLKLGLVWKNVNAPSFATADGDDYQLDSQLRLGAAWRPMKMLLLAADLDLNSTRSQLIDKVEYQEFAAGVEYYVVPLIFCLRLGINQNLAQKEDSPGSSVGLGLRLGKIFRLDVALNVRGNLGGLFDLFKETDDLTDLDLPDSASLAISMAFNTKF